MTDDDELRAALDEVAALRAALGPHGLGEPVDGTDPADRRDAAADAAAVAAILAAASGGSAASAGSAAGAGPSAGAGSTAGTGPAGSPAAPADPTPRATDGPGTPPAPVADLADARRRRTRPWWLAATGAAAAVALAVAVVAPWRTPPAAVAVGSPPMLAFPIDPAALARGEGVPARQALLDLAATAAEQDDPEPAGDVQHTLSQSWLLTTTARWDEDPSSTVDPTVVEAWLEPDGSVVATEWRGEHLGADGRLAAVDTAPSDASVDRLRAGTFDPERVADLSRDPDVLRTQLRATLADAGCGPDADPAVGAWCLYRAVADLSDWYVLPSDLEAAVWTALADEPGVTVAGEVVDRTGRRSMAVAVPPGPADADPTVRVLLVDASTGRLSGREEVVLGSELLGFDEPTVTQFRYTVASDRVAEAGGPPVGEARSASTRSPRVE